MKNQYRLESKFKYANWITRSSGNLQIQNVREDIMIMEVYLPSLGNQPSDILSYVRVAKGT